MRERERERERWLTFLPYYFVLKISFFPSDTPSLGCLKRLIAVCERAHSTRGIFGRKKCKSKRVCVCVCVCVYVCVCERERNGNISESVCVRFCWLTNFAWDVWPYVKRWVSTSLYFSLYHISSLIFREYASELLSWWEGEEKGREREREGERERERGRERERERGRGRVTLKKTFW